MRLQKKKIRREAKPGQANQHHVFIDVSGSIRVHLVLFIYSSEYINSNTAIFLQQQPYFFNSSLFFCVFVPRTSSAHAKDLITFVYVSCKLIVNSIQVHTAIFIYMCQWWKTCYLSFGTFTSSEVLMDYFLLCVDLPSFDFSLAYRGPCTQVVLF